MFVHKDLTRSHSNTVLTLQAIHSNYEPFKNTLVAKSGTTSCKVTLKFHLDVHVSCIILDLPFDTRRNQLSTEKTSLLLYGCDCNEYPAVDFAFH